VVPMTAKKGRLLLRWSERERDFLISFPRSQDGGMLWGFVKHIHDGPYKIADLPHATKALVIPQGRTLLEELEARGYDLKTLRIQVDKKA
jgi:hypothetical protein